jgi:hypothetical protein
MPTRERLKKLNAARLNEAAKCSASINEWINPLTIAPLRYVLSNANRRTEAHSVLALIDASFVLTLKLMGLAQSLSSMLQSSTADMAAAVDLISVTKDMLQKAMNDDDSLWDSSVGLCRMCDVEVVADDSTSVSHSMDPNYSRYKRRSAKRLRKLPSVLSGSIVMETV